MDRFNNCNLANTAACPHQTHAYMLKFLYSIDNSKSVDPIKDIENAEKLCTDCEEFEKES